MTCLLLFLIPYRQRQPETRTPAHAPSRTANTTTTTTTTTTTITVSAVIPRCAAAWVAALFAGAAIAQATGPTSTTAPPVYRCGNNYSHNPCDNGAVIAVDDARTPQQQADSEQVAARDAQLAHRMEQSRLRQQKTDQAAASRGHPPQHAKPQQKPVQKPPEQPVIVRFTIPAQPHTKPAKPAKPAKPGKPGKPGKRNPARLQ